MTTICVFCASSERIPSRYLDLAAQVGGELARRGHELVSGGGSVSCMGALARAARAGGARTVGVIPQALTLREVADREADELIVTPDMRSRKAEMGRRAGGFLVLPGGLGTLEELLEIWVSRSLAMHDKPVVGLDPDGVFAPLRDQVERLVDAGFVPRRAADAMTWTDDVAVAFDRLEAGRARPPAPGVTEILEAEP